MRHRRRNLGHSLIELLVVIAIMALVMSFVVPGAWMLIKAVRHLKGN